ncbi:ABC transporter permease subunit [Caballeronia mineralivorans]|jgi:polar amino acid transport system permease protein|uniref:ABC transporter permease subunit n=1 Tax=Caballeronia mineralivorans TaxID=2010198 RepID=UPI0023F3FFB7|nr:ABC transporter permease subunit [Caballeronia mineralivorans]MDB5782599.1 amino acid transporter [Caballeronia mineralivorans]MEA3098234.1 polar amino acid transport system permease protein [Caballeronia mineralivorans]
MDALLHSFITATARLGLDYRFLLDDYERVPFVQGLGVSIEIIVSTMTASAVAGLVLLLALRGRNQLVAGLARGFIEVTRNTPTLVQLYCAFLVLNMLITQWLRARGFDNPFQPFFWVVLVLSLHKAAFHAEALRAGFDALPSQTLEGAASLGLSRATRFWRIELPLALRAALPALVNNMVELVKASAVASAIAVGDVTYESIMIWTQRDNVLALMLLILAFFGVLTWLVTLAGRWLERRYRVPGYGY